MELGNTTELSIKVVNHSKTPATSADSILATLLQSVISTQNNEPVTNKSSTAVTFSNSASSTSGIGTLYTEGSTMTTLFKSVSPTYGNMAISTNYNLDTSPHSVTTTHIGMTSTLEYHSLIILLVVVFLSVTFLIGILGNSFYLWVLGCKMKRTVSTVLFQHLISAHLLFTMIIPFYAIFLLKGRNWIFGLAVCKLTNFALSLSMFTSVFLLTVISVDRCVLVVYPIWSKFHRTTKKSSVISFSVWALSSVFSLPGLAFPQVSSVANNKQECVNNYAFSDDWDTPEIQQLRMRIHISMFTLRLIVGFVVPFLVMMVCYLKLAVKLKAEHINTSSKPFKVIATAAGSFFVCWLPYHLYNGLDLYKESVSKLLFMVVLLVAIVLCCVNASCTPILYLFIGENFRSVFKMSLLSLFGRTFNENAMINKEIDNIPISSGTSC